jgi:hypothetical protein
MVQKQIRISMTSFADFVVCDSLGKFSKVKAIRKQYEREYFPGADFWSRFQESVEAILRSEGRPGDLEEIHQSAKHNRGGQYLSACEGFRKFWGNKGIELISTPKVATWSHNRLQVRVNPEWILKINGDPTVVKLHLKKDLVLSQRLANPLLHLVDQKFGTKVGGPRVAILEVHQGKLWTAGRSGGDLEPVLRMQAAAFVAGWDVLEGGQSAA